MKSRTTAVMLAFATAVPLFACSDTNDPLTTTNNNTTVRFFNATTGSLALDVAQNGSVGSGNGNIPFGSASECTKVNDANPQLSVRPAGSTTNLTGFTPSFSASNTYTVLVTGTQSAPVFTTLNDQFTASGANSAGVRIVNATTTATLGTGTWDIFVNPAATVGTPNATAVLRNSASSFLTVPAGQANVIRLTNAGQTARLQDITVPSLAPGTATTVVVTDAATPGGTTLQAFTLPACST